MLKNHPLSHLSMTYYPIMATSRFEGLTEDQLVRAYASAKGRKARKMKMIEHMIQKVNFQFNLSSYNNLQTK